MAARRKASETTVSADRPRGASDLWGTVPFDVKRHVSPHGQVTAVSMMKDEGPFVIEWVAHHLAIGFTDLVVYTNDCSDGTDDMLIRLEELGLCHHRRNVIPQGIRPQPSALNYAQDEPVVGDYRRGVLAMARSAAPNSQGSQFFIVLDDGAAGPLESVRTYAILGEVTAGLDVVDAIAAVERDQEDRPVVPVTILNTTVSSPAP